MHYAGWADKYAQVAGSTNPVAGPYFTFSLPEPTGVVGVFAPQESSLLGLVSVLAPVLTTGNTAVVVASETRPLPAVSLTEVLATSDVPGGVVNLLTGVTSELASWLAAHRDVNAIDLSGIDAGDRPALQRCRGRQRQAGLRPALDRLGRRTGAVPPRRVRRDQDRLAPDRRLSRRPEGGLR